MIQNEETKDQSEDPMDPIPTEIQRPIFTITDETAEQCYETIQTVSSDQNAQTLDRPPQVDNYRLTVAQWKNIRPSMPVLMHSSTKRLSDEHKYTSRHNSEVGMENFDPQISVPSKPLNNKMSWFEGVYIPAFTNIVGTLLYLRMGFVAGQAGILGGLGIVVFSTFVISITALSLSGICSNGEIKKGGMYYVISRALGPQFGGVIGVIFSLANVGMAALYIVGIAEFTSDLLHENGYHIITTSKQNDIRLICAALMLVTFAGPKVENGFTLVFFSTYFISYINWIVGTFLPISDYQQKRGVTGYSWTTFRMNLMPDFQDGNSFSTVFAIFFPGFTGMLASTMFCDELRNPGKDVPLGLFSCIGSTFIMYAVAVVSTGSIMVRAADGIMELDELTDLWKVPACGIIGANVSCEYGLNYFYQVAELTSAWSPLIVIGMFGMTISSTMTNLDQGPINFHAACKDRIFPYTRFFEADIKRVYVLLAALTAVITLIGDLNVLNEIVTNMFMAIYVMVNYACFDASFARTPGWRPKFPYYSMWVSLFGAVLCVFVMFLVSITSAVVICLMFAVCLAYFHYVHPEVNWGDTHQAHVYRSALSSLQKLTSSEIHVKNYRPQILLLCGNPSSRVQLLDFAHSITKGDSLLLCAHVVPYPQSERLFTILRQLTHEIEEWLKLSKLKAFYVNLANESLRGGMQNVLQTAGLGKLKPNVLMLGFKTDWWKSEKADKVNDYVGIIRDAFENNFGVCVFRNGNEGFDLAEALLESVGGKETDELPNLFETTHIVHRHISHKRHLDFHGLQLGLRRNNGGHRRDAVGDSRKSKSVPFCADKWQFAQQSTVSSEETRQQTYGTTYAASWTLNETIPTIYENGPLKLPDLAKQITVNDEKRKELANRMNAFHRKQRNVRIDVWWLYDDGGLTLLIPHLLRMPKSYLEGAELRVITYSAAEVDENELTTLLEKFRIEFSAVKVIDVTKQKLHPETRLIEKWKSPEADYITEAELSAQRRRTHRQLLTRQLLLQYSADAALIVLTLPVPNETVGSALYMSWLQTLTDDLPPVLLVRGNQTSVLTFYS